MVMPEHAQVERYNAMLLTACYGDVTVTTVYLSSYSEMRCSSRPCLANSSVASCSFSAVNNRKNDWLQDAHCWALEHIYES